MKESKFIWCCKREQWRGKELGKCRGCGRGRGKGCALSPQITKGRNKKLDKHRKI